MLSVCAVLCTALTRLDVKAEVTPFIFQWAWPHHVRPVLCLTLARSVSNSMTLGSTISLLLCCSVSGADLGADWGWHLGQDWRFGRATEAQVGGEATLHVR